MRVDEESLPDVPVPIAPRHGAGWAAAAVERHVWLFYGCVIACFLGLFVFGARVLTLEADEAWILLSTQQAFGFAIPVTDILGHPTVTTGGPHLLIHGLIDRLTFDLMAHRAVSLGAAAGLLFLVFGTLRATGNSARIALAGTALFAAVPGFLLQASLATGETIATLFLIGAGVHWVRRGAGSMRGALLSGLLLGIACSARMNCAAAVVALLIYAMYTQEAEWGGTLRGLVAGAVAATVAGASILAYRYAANVGAGGASNQYLSEATGVGKAKSIGEMLQGLLIANQYIPVVLIAVIVGLWFVRRLSGSSATGRKAPDVAGVALFMGLALLGAWIILAPIPHLRYLWPALACLWLAGIVLLLDAWTQVQSSTARLALHGIVATACVYALIAASLGVAQGDSLTLVYQAIGTAPRQAVPSAAQCCRGAADQRALASFVASRPTSARFFTSLPTVAFPIVYLSGRTMNPLEALDGKSERYIVINPANYAVWRPDPRFDAWRRTFTRLAFRRGKFAAFLVAEGAPVPPTHSYAVGTDDLF